MMLFNKIKNLIKRAAVSNNTTDDKIRHIVQVNYIGRTADIEGVYPYGMSANAPVGSAMLMFNVGGSEENRAGIAYNPQDRFKNLKPGEAQFGNQIKQTFIKFLDNGNIDIFTDADVNINADNVNITAALTTINGDLVVTGQTDLSGTGGPPIARVGDTVSNNVITSGSANSRSN